MSGRREKAEAVIREAWLRRSSGLWQGRGISVWVPDSRLTRYKQGDRFRLDLPPHRPVNFTYDGDGVIGEFDGFVVRVADAP